MSGGADARGERRGLLDRSRRRLRGHQLVVVHAQDDKEHHGDDGSDDYRPDDLQPLARARPPLLVGCLPALDALPHAAHALREALCLVAPHADARLQGRDAVLVLVELAERLDLRVNLPDQVRRVVLERLRQAARQAGQLAQGDYGLLQSAEAFEDRVVRVVEGLCRVV